VHFHARFWNKGDKGLTLAIQELLKDELKKVEFKDFDIKKFNTLDKKKIAQMGKWADVFILGGGGLYGKWLFPLKTHLLESVKTPLVLYSIGYDKTFGNPDLGKESKKGIKELNRIAKLSSVRDRLTFNLLKRLGIRNHQLVVDPGAFLKPKKFSFRLQAKTNVGLNIAYHWWIRTHEPSPEVKIPLREKVFEAVKETGNWLSKEGAGIYYMPHFETEKRVFEKFRKEFPLKQCNCSPAELVYAYSKFDATIAMNMHAGIFSFNAGTPFIFIEYNVKNRAFAEIVGLENYCIPVKQLTPKKLLCKTKRMLKNSKKLKKKLKARKKKLWKGEKRFLKKIAEVI